jgi:2-haloacid dehalogenase
VPIKRRLIYQCRDEDRLKEGEIAMAQFKAALFDAYGTLFDVYSVGALAEGIFPGHGTPLADLWRDKQMEYTRLRTLCGRYADFRQVTGDALDFACEKLGLDLTAASRDRLMRQYERLTPFPECLEALRRLCETGLPLAILSNGTPAMIASAVAAAGMDGLFAHILSADQVRKFKTAPEVYQLGPDTFGCEPREMLFVSSNGWDACGATWFGFTTFWINRTSGPLERLGVTPTGEGRSLDDVVDFVRQAAT